MSNIMLRKKELLEVLSSKDVTNRIEVFIGKDKAEKFKASLMMLAMDESLKDCNVKDLIKCGLEVAELGLEVTKSLGQAYIVKYKQKPQVVIGYKGYLKLLEENGKITKARPVYDVDKFDMEVEGFNEKVKFKPNFKERNEDDTNWVNNHLDGVLVSILDTISNVEMNFFVPKKKIMQIAGKSPSKNSKFSPYVDWALELYLAKAIKYVISKRPMTYNIAQAVEIDNKLDTELVKESKETPELGLDDVDFEIVEDEEPEKEGLLK